MYLQQKKAKHKATPTPEPSQDKPAKKSKAKPKAKAEDAEGSGGAKGKKPRKKKDKNEPKKGLSAFMFFSQANREKVSANQIACTELYRVYFFAFHTKAGCLSERGAAAAIPKAVWAGSHAATDKQAVSG